DFPALLVQGLRDRLAGQPPEAMARVQLFVNTERMRRRITDLFIAGPPGLLPRIRLVTDIGRDLALPGLPPAIPPLRRRLEIAQLVARLLDGAPDLAPRSALYDLSDSLAALLDEMQGEGVTPAAVAGLDVSDHSAHWARTQTFLGIVAPFFADDAPPDAEARQRLAVEALARRWADTPPETPVIVAGSTGSRGTTARLMQAVAGLPQGALVLPGFDFDLPGTVWAGMGDALTSEDHPQFRFLRLLDLLGAPPGDVRRWVDAPPPAPARNRLVSLALRPAPVTDQWLDEGRRLTDIPKSTEALTLIQAPNPRAEALAIALILRESAEQGRRAALITPDRGLTRQVAAALDRWGIIPDDSAGRPLALSAPGRFLRQVAEVFAQRLTAESLLALLKHPLAASGADRGNHLRWTRDLELRLRRHGPVFPDAAAITEWAAARPADGVADWAAWLARCLPGDPAPGDLPLTAHVARHITLAQALAAGPGATGSGTLWDEAAGAEARAVADDLTLQAPHGGAMTAAEYRDLFGALIGRGMVRESALTHPNIAIWGTLEARVQGADLVVLGGLNDGSWPQLPPPDPWLNRQMRLKAGLLLPERQIGLSAHDFQQAIAAPQVVLTRARRNADAETVPSRWLNRMLNLLAGLPDQGGPAALDAMSARGDLWLRRAVALETPAATVPPARRPAPCPPPGARPRELPVTAIRTLIRDPYAVYARRILRLYPLDPLRAQPDPLLRGSVLHRVLEDFVTRRPESETLPQAEARLLAITAQVLADEVPWPAVRALWQARLARAAPFFLTIDRQGGTPVVVEKAGKVTLTGLPFTLTAKPDRIDLLPDGRAHVMDYKTGSPPSKAQQKAFDKQLLLEAAMVERGAFAALGPVEVARTTYVGLGATPKALTDTPDAATLAEAWDHLNRLIAAYLQPDRGYPSRRAVFKAAEVGDYDHLARFGEWQMTDPPEPEAVG
ncbi:MAG TPA: double-strand break repair protein AddB, partial [Paracoccaceae bacterium]|nr:double-strand break repair protein AddB [Paracoccaceae bacterium]